MSFYNYVRNHRSSRLSLSIMFWGLFIALAAGCSPASDNAQTSQAGVQTPKQQEYENLFYRMDFETKPLTLDEVSNTFFTTFPHDDPTEGDVVYDRKQWQNAQMLEVKPMDGLYLYIKERGDQVAFDSVRMTSKAYYNLHEETDKLLFVFKGKLPSQLGLWPAWWLNGSHQAKWLYQAQGQSMTDRELDASSGVGHFYDTPSAVNGTDWPAAGEIDLIETINGEKQVHNTLHTCPQMYDSLWNQSSQRINCANGKPSDPNAGCSGQAYPVSQPAGTFAVTWSKSEIEFFYWPEETEVRFTGGPLDTDPDPSLWASQLKNRVTLLATDATCDPDLHQPWQCNSCQNSRGSEFANMKMIFNMTLCGKWAGNQFDDSPNSLQNCRAFIFDEGRSLIDQQHIKIEYVAVQKLN